MLDFWSYLFP